jgi:hypothetical protein
MRKVMTCFILGITLFIVVSDVLAYLYGENATYSVIMTDWAAKHPTLVLAFGVLMGHWFWPAKGSKD